MKHMFVIMFFLTVVCLLSANSLIDQYSIVVSPSNMVSICTTTAPLADITEALNTAFAKNNPIPTFVIDLLYTNYWERMSYRLSPETETVDPFENYAKYKKSRATGIPLLSICETNKPIAYILEKIVEQSQNTLKTSSSTNAAIIYPALHGLNLKIKHEKITREQD